MPHAISQLSTYNQSLSDGTYDTNSILDLYVPCVSSLRFSLWLDKHGYVFRPTSSQRSKIQSLTSNKILSPGIRGVEGGMYVDGATHTYIRSISLRTAPAAGRMRKRSFGGVEEKLEFIQSTSPAGNITPRTVRIMVADPHAPPLMCILLFHTSEHSHSAYCSRINSPKIGTDGSRIAFMMNFITHDAAYSLFPNATFLQRECITFSEIPEKHSHLPVYAWHRRRGYKIPAFPLAMDRSKSLWKHIGSRWPGDIRSWKLSFDVLNFRDNEAREKVALHSEYLRFSGFSVYDKVTVECSEEDLEGNPDPGTYLLGYRVPTILFRVISSKLIKSKLILPNNIFGHLINFLDSQPRLEDEIWDTFGPWLSAEPM